MRRRSQRLVVRYRKPRDAKDCWQPLEAGKARRDPRREPSARAWSFRHLELGLRASRTVRK